jgi:hypothetical protein
MRSNIVDFNDNSRNLSKLAAALAIGEIAGFLIKFTENTLQAKVCCSLQPCYLTPISPRRN